MHACFPDQTACVLLTTSSPVQMMWNIDQGQAADISGISDADIKSGVKNVLKLLGLRKGRKVRSIHTSVPYAPTCTCS